MKDLENDFVGRFKDREEPEGDFRTEDLWGSIATELEKDSDDPAGFANWKGWLIVLLLLVIAGGVWWTVSLSPKGSQMVETVQHEMEAGHQAVEDVNKNKPAPLTDVANEKPSSEDTPSATGAGLGISVASGDEKGSFEKNLARTSEGNARNKKVIVEKNKEDVAIAESVRGINENYTNGPEVSRNTIAENQGSGPSATGNEKGSAKRLGELNSSTAPKDLKAEGESQSVGKTVEQLINRKQNAIALLVQEDINYLIVPEQLLPAPKVVPKAESEGTPIRKQTKLHWELGLVAGGNQTLANHTVTDNAEYQNLRNISEGAAAGAKFGLELGVRRKRWSLSTGLSYEDLWRKFNYETLADNAVLLNNVLLRVVYDPVTETTIARTFGDALLEGQSARRVQHFNNYRLWSVPISMGYHRRTPRWVFGARAGVVLQFAGRQTGRFAAADGSVADFGPDDEATLFQPFSIGLRINPELGYRITDRLTLSLTPDLIWSSQQPTFNQTVGTSRYGGNVGLRWVIK